MGGRVGLIGDGIPLAYLTPVDFAYFMESPEDRSKGFVMASCIRILRYSALILGLLLPAVYVAIATFHQGIIPLPLLRAIAESKNSVPFTAFAEIAGLMIAFELLQEAGIHLPKSIGQSVSIIGGIIIGSAAVDAKLLSPIALIVVSTTGVCGFVLPDRDLAEAIRVWRFINVVLAYICGIYGVVAGMVILLIHLKSLTSMDVPYLSVGNMKIVRTRLMCDKWRNKLLNPQDRRKQK